MLHHLKWDNLEARRNNLRVILLYKIINNLVDISPEKQLVLTKIVSQEATHKDTFSHQPKLMPINIPFSLLLLGYGIVYPYTLSVLNH